MAGADAKRRRIEAHPWPRGGVEVVRANRGYTLYSRRTAVRSPALVTCALSVPAQTGTPWYDCW